MVKVVSVFARVLEYRKRTLWPLVLPPVRPASDWLLVTSTDMPPMRVLKPAPTFTAWYFSAVSRPP
ncbi:hypothetical protein D9M70_577070 [compost metagenome]